MADPSPFWSGGPRPPARIGRSSLAVLSLFALAACGGGGGGGGSTSVQVGRFLLVAAQDSVVVHQLPSLHPLAYQPIDGFVRDLALAPSQRFLYVAVGGVAGIELRVFALDGIAGELTETPGSPFALPAGADQPLALDPTGARLYTGGVGLHAFALDVTTGSPTELAGSPFGAAAYDGIVLDPTGRLLFATSGALDQVAVFAVALDGSLSELASSPFAAGNQPGALAVHPRERLLYVANALSDDVSVFTVAFDGTLTPLAASPFPTGDGPVDLALSEDGTLLFTADESGASVSSFVLAAGGALTPAPSGPRPVGALPSALALDPDGSVYAAASGGRQVSELEADPSDADLVVTRVVRTRNFPASLAIVTGASPVTVATARAYTAQRFAAELETWAVDSATGELEELAGSPAALSSVGYALAGDSRGRFVFSAATAGGVDVLALDADGLPSLVTGSPFQPGSKLHALATEPSGRFLYGVSSALHAFSIDPDTGALTPLAGSPYDLGFGAQLSELAVDPTGRALYVRAVFLFVTLALDAASGVPSPVPGSTFVEGFVRSLAVHPAGRFVYTTNDQLDTLTRYSTAAATAEIQSTLASSVPTGPVPIAAAVDPSGAWIYTAHPLDESIGAFALALGDGVPTELAASPFADGTTAASRLRIDPSGRWLYALSTNTGVSLFEIDPATGALTARGDPAPSMLEPFDLVVLGRVE